MRKSTWKGGPRIKSPYGGLEPGDRQGRILAQASATVLAYWREAAGYQRFLYVLAALLLASALLHTIVLLVTGGWLQGDVSWRKPIVFGEAFGVTLLSLGWIMSFLPIRRIVGWILSGIVGIASAGEVLLISMQQWRGVPSHFNTNTPFDAAVFGAMGGLVILIETVIIVLAVWTWVSLEAPRALGWSIRFGMLLLVASQALGNLIIANGSSTFGEAGAMKVPHALSLHGAQVLPFLAFLLLFASWDETRRIRTVVMAAIAYAAVVAVSAAQAFRGLAPLELGVLPGLVMVGSSIVMVSAYVITLRALVGSAKANAG